MYLELSLARAISGFGLNGEDVHQYLKAHLNYAHRLSLQDSDFW